MLGGCRQPCTGASLSFTGQKNTLLPCHSPAGQATGQEKPQPGGWTAHSLSRTQVHITFSRLEVGSWGAGPPSFAKPTQGRSLGAVD